ncbi:tRNA lysidine(34) synthetase TilS [Larkinella ripae]
MKPDTQHDFPRKDLCADFRNFVESQRLFDPGDRILLTVSAGIDSVVMADLFRLAGFQYGIAHVNFQLRGDESEGDEAFVRALAERHGVRFHTVRMPAKQQAPKSGFSTQMAARQFRYEWFEKIAKDSGYECIATAHHQDDVLETVLLNLVRGTGLSGLRGIPVRQGRVIRPLWFADRACLEAHARQHALAWREDSSNASDYYRRNRLRHQVIPVLKEINPNLVLTLQTTLARIRAADALVGREIRQSWETLAQNRLNGVALPVQRLIDLPEWEYRLAEWLKPYGFQYAQLGPLTEAVRSAGFGQTFFSATHRVIRDRDFLLIEPLQAADNEQVVIRSLPDSVIPVFGEYGLHWTLIEPSEGFQIPAHPQIACLDADRLQWPLTIRRWQTGDRFRPLGLKGSQSVGNFLTNRKVSVTERRHGTVLLSGNRIAWLIGYRPDDHFRITSQTRRILLIEQKVSQS